MISTISFCTKLAYGNSNVVQIVQQTVQEKANNGGNKNITQSLSNMPFQQASLDRRNLSYKAGAVEL
jgi:hypothetical protein